MTNVFKSKLSFLPLASVIAVAMMGSCGRSQSAGKKPDAPQNGDSTGEPSPTANATATPVSTSTPTAAPTATAEPTASPTPLVVLPTFDDINARIFQTKCVKCHNGTKSAGKVDLTSYDKIMNSVVFPPLVIPRSPEQSNVYTIVRDGAMPKGSTRLEAVEVSAIQKWIAAGGKRNESDPDPTPVPLPTEPPD